MALIIEIVNKSKLADISDYEYRVRINQRIIKEGKVYGHERKKGWLALAQMVLDAEKKGEEYEGKT